MLTAAASGARDVLLPCDQACLDRLHECVPGLSSAPAELKLPKIAEHLGATMMQLSHRQGNLSAANQSSPAAAPAIDSAAMDTAAELLETKLDIALSRGAIDAATRQRLEELFLRQEDSSSHAVLLSRSRAGGRPLALAIAEILIDNLPVANGEATPLQILSRIIPGESDGADLGPFAQHMKQIANRR